MEYPLCLYAFRILESSMWFKLRAHVINDSLPVRAGMLAMSSYR